MNRDSKHENELELKSDDFTEILEKVPHWTLRSGIMIIFCFILLLVILSLIIRYPDQIVTRATIGTKTPTSSIKSKSTGAIKLLVKDKQDVRFGQTIAVIQSSGNYSDIGKLKMEISALLGKYKNDNLKNLYIDQSLIVGELQANYLKVVDYINQINRFNVTGIPKIDRNSTLSQIDRLKLKSQSYGKLNEAGEKLIKLEYEQFSRDSLLFSKRIISASEFENSKKRLINLSSALEEAIINKSSNEILLDQMNSQDRQNVKEIFVTIDELKKMFVLSLNELSNDIQIWESKYTIISPINGKISIPNNVVEDSYVTQGDEVLKIVPHESAVIGNAFLNSTQMAEVKSDQNVLVKLDNYPFVDYGIVRARVTYISLVPNDGYYNVKISFDSDKLTSSTGQHLEIKQDMGATIEIISKNTSVFKRIFHNILKILN